MRSTSATVGQFDRATRNAYDWLRRAPGVVQSERTPFETVFQSDIHRVRYYAPPEPNFATPVVIVAPLAVRMSVYDLFPNRSLVRFLLERGFAVYMLDWGAPTRRHDHYRLSTYYAELMPQMLHAIRHHGQQERLTLHGWSLGGMLSVSYVAHSDDAAIANLVLVGSPCNYQAAGPLRGIVRGLSRSLHAVERATNRNLLDLPDGLLHTPGIVNVVGFKAMSPVASVRGYVDLARNLDDRQYVSSHATTAAFLDQMLAYPGGTIQDIGQFLWADNVLARGRLPQPDQPKLLPNISASMLAVASESDALVPVKASAPLLDIVGSQDKRLLTVGGGHFGILAGSRAPAESWGVIAEWLAKRDQDPG